MRSIRWTVGRRIAVITAIGGATVATLGLVSLVAATGVEADATVVETHSSARALYEELDARAGELAVTGRVPGGLLVGDRDAREARDPLHGCSVYGHAAAASRAARAKAMALRLHRAGRSGTTRGRGPSAALQRSKDWPASSSISSRSSSRW